MLIRNDYFGPIEVRSESDTYVGFASKANHQGVLYGTFFYDFFPLVLRFFANLVIP